jgi:hypothetical protein
MTGDPFFAGVEPNYLLISRTVVPELLAAGATDRDIDRLMVENPRRFFAGSKPGAAARPPKLEHAGADGEAAA